MASSRLLMNILKNFIYIVYIYFIVSEKYLQWIYREMKTKRKQLKDDYYQKRQSVRDVVKSVSVWIV